MPAYNMLTKLSVASPDLEALRHLNNEHAQQLSYTDPEHFRGLIERSFFAASVNETEAFLIAFDQQADYQSPHFLWFKKIFPRFVYVDRLATATQARGRGHAITLYDALFSAARAERYSMVVCEINEIPPNPVSVALHARFGFVKVGEQTLPAAGEDETAGFRTVGYYVKRF